nr:family 43 glycosylhydrolase [Pseudobacteroides cellulosolvens]
MRVNFIRKAILFIILSVFLSSFTISSLAESITVTNPIVKQRADPWVYKHTDGYYHMTASVPEYDRIELRRATTIQGLSTAAPTIIWKRHSSGIMGDISGHLKFIL